MRVASRYGKCGVLLLVLLSPIASARWLDARAARVAASGVEAEAVHVRLDWPADAPSGQLQLEAGVLAWPDSGYRFRQLRFQCPLERDGERWRCEGPIRSATGGGLQLRLQLTGTAPALRLAAGGSRLSVARADRGWRIDGSRVPVGWLAPLLAQVWPEATLTGGTLGAELTLDTGAATPRLAGTLAADGFGLDTRDGRIAAAGLGLRGPITLSLGDATALRTELTLAGGELLAGPWYSALPSTPVALTIAATHEPDGRWQLPELVVRDDDVLQIDASATLDPAAEAPLTALSTRLQSRDLASAQARYFDALLGSYGAGGLQLAGALDARISHTPQDWTIAANLSHLALTDQRGRFTIADGNGELGWTSTDQALSGRFGWHAAALYDIALGPGTLPWRSVDGALALTEPVSVAALGGRIGADRFAWQPAHDRRGPQLDLALALTRLDLAQLAQRFGWPPFRGELSGRMPAARYEDGVLRFDGGLEIGLFDGRIAVGALQLARPFGVAPRLEADLQLAGLDLQPLTAAFGFGEITGRLNGRIAGLRLIDWTPVAFDAAFRTDPKAKPRRISQRAVGDLTSIGGGGLVGGLQQQMLKVFDSFAYSAIGLSCTLADEVCTMGGLDRRDGGYTIVDGAGLPHITVIGHQRRVDWPVLVARLKAATEGQKPVVD